MNHRERAPEQDTVDYLTQCGYAPGTIIAYLEASKQKRWPEHNFDECAAGEKMTFGVCRKVGGEEKPEIGPDGKPKEKKEPKQEKSPMEAKLEKAAKAQGSDVSNNRKVVIDGKAYGWALLNGKPIMVEWGKVAGEKKVGPKQGRSRRGRGGGGSNEGRIAGLRKALEKQTTDSGRAAIQRQIDELGG